MSASSAPLLAETIRSVVGQSALKQGVAELEYLIIDGGSADATAEIVSADAWSLRIRSSTLNQLTAEENETPPAAVVADEPSAAISPEPQAEKSAAPATSTAAIPDPSAAAKELDDALANRSAGGLPDVTPADVETSAQEKSALADIIVPFCTKQPVNRSWPKSILRGFPNYCIGASVAVGFVEAIDSRNWQDKLMSWSPSTTRVSLPIWREFPATKRLP
jgi:hypothetical protein